MFCDCAERRSKTKVMSGVKSPSVVFGECQRKRAQAPEQIAPLGILWDVSQVTKPPLLVQRPPPRVCERSLGQPVQSPRMLPGSQDKPRNTAGRDRGTNLECLSSLMEELTPVCPCKGLADKAPRPTPSTSDAGDGSARRCGGGRDTGWPLPGVGG